MESWIDNAVIRAVVRVRLGGKEVSLQLYDVKKQGRSYTMHSNDGAP